MLYKIFCYVLEIAFGFAVFGWLFGICCSLLSPIKPKYYDDEEEEDNEKDEEEDEEKYERSATCH